MRTAMVRLSFLSLFTCVLCVAIPSSAQTTTSSTSTAATAPPDAPPPTSFPSSSARPPLSASPRFSNSSRSATGTRTVTSRTKSIGTSDPSTAPDVLLRVPDLSVGRIELDVDNLAADVNLNAKVANLVTINAGVAVSIRKVNITIDNVQAKLELIVRLGHLTDIVNRVFQSLDLNPLLITAINEVTNLVDTVVGAVDGLLGSITHGGTTLSFLIDNLGNIVQQVLGAAGNTVSSIVGDYTTNMTFTGDQKQLQNGNIQKTYQYSPLGSLVDIIFNSLGQVVQATVQKKGSSGSSGSGSSSAGGSSASGGVPAAATAGAGVSTGASSNTSKPPTNPTTGSGPSTPKPPTNPSAPAGATTIATTTSSAATKTDG